MGLTAIIYTLLIWVCLALPFIYLCLGITVYIQQRRIREEEKERLITWRMITKVNMAVFRTLDVLIPILIIICIPLAVFRLFDFFRLVVFGNCPLSQLNNHPGLITWQKILIIIEPAGKWIVSLFNRLSS